MKNKHYIIMGLCSVGLLATGAILDWKFNSSASRQGDGDSLSDRALLALIKNDQKSFEKFISLGGDLQEALPVIDGKTYTVAEGLSYFDRPGFVKYLQSKKIKFLKESNNQDHDILTLSIPKNNPELLELYIKEEPNLSLIYGDKKWTLLHMASAFCSQKLVSILHEKGQLNWNTRAKSGATPLTLAAEHECLPVLSYWKEQKANFKAKDGRGRSALGILKKKKDAALLAFAESFEVRLPATVTKPKVEVSFYKKRKIPKDQIVDHRALIEPEDRPIEAIETAEFSEFAD